MTATLRFTHRFMTSNLRARAIPRVAGLNHVGVVVDNIDSTEAKVKAAGYEPHNHADYEPGKRFYFDGPDGIEFEVVHYD